MQAGVASAQTVIAEKGPGRIDGGARAQRGKGRNRDARRGRRREDPVHRPAAREASRRWTPPSTSTSAPDLTPGHRRRRNQAPPAPDAGCTRKDVIGVFWSGRSRISSSTPSPRERDRLPAAGAGGPHAKAQGELWTSTPTGLIVFGGVGLGWFRDAFDNQCGNSQRLQRRRFTHHLHRRRHVLAGSVPWRRGGVAEAGRRQRQRRRLELPFQQRLQLHLCVINGKVGIPLGKVQSTARAAPTTTAAR